MIHSSWQIICWNLWFFPSDFSHKKSVKIRFFYFSVFLRMSHLSFSFHMPCKFWLQNSQKWNCCGQYLQYIHTSCDLSDTSKYYKQQWWEFSVCWSVQQKSTWEKKILAHHFFSWFLTWNTTYCRRHYKIAITIPEAILHITGRAWSNHNTRNDSILRQKLVLKELLHTIEGYGYHTTFMCQCIFSCLTSGKMFIVHIMTTWQLNTM